MEIDPGLIHVDKKRAANNAENITPSLLQWYRSLLHGPTDVGTRQSLQSGVGPRAPLFCPLLFVLYSVDLAQLKLDPARIAFVLNHGRYLGSPTRT